MRTSSFIILLIIVVLLAGAAYYFMSANGTPNPATALNGGEAPTPSTPNTGGPGPSSSGITAPPSTGAGPVSAAASSSATVKVSKTSRHGAAATTTTTTPVASEPSTTPTLTPPPPAATSSIPTSVSTVMIATSTANGRYLVAANGMTLYTYDGDVAGSGISNCTDTCLATWPPYSVLSTAPPLGGRGIADGTLGTITRMDDGSIQVTYQGRPLYFYYNDVNPGDTNGVGIPQWKIATP